MLLNHLTNDTLCRGFYLLLNPFVRINFLMLYQSSEVSYYYYISSFPDVMDFDGLHQLSDDKPWMTVMIGNWRFAQWNLTCNNRETWCLYLNLCWFMCIFYSIDLKKCVLCHKRSLRVGLLLSLLIFVCFYYYYYYHSVSKHLQLVLVLSL